MAGKVTPKPFEVDVSTPEGCRAVMRHNGLMLRQLLEHYKKYEDADYRKQLLDGMAKLAESMESCPR